MAVDRLSFDIEKGEFVTLLGPSGCGKSTTLHSIAGLIKPDSGTIRLRNQNVNGVPPNERNIGLVFQHSALFPHMTVEGNLKYGLRMHDVDASAYEDRIQRFLELVQMTGYENSKPGELSGGQQRRISLARALIYEPDILLLDEPLTGLDQTLRKEMRNEITLIQNELDVTTLHVTHDQSEALSMSDRVIVMNDGEKEQADVPTELYANPETPFVATFVGESSIINADVVGEDPYIARVNEGRLELSDELCLDINDSIDLYIRPESVRIHSEQGATGPNTFQGEVTDMEYFGSFRNLIIELGEGSIVNAQCDKRADFEVGSDVYVEFPPEDIIVL